MVSDNRWVATTKGIVVFLLTALLFVFWYDRDRELAESHVTAVRFGFYRVIWIEVLCGITVAWCVRKKFRFRLPDAGVLLLGGYVLLRSVYGDGMVGYRTELWILFVILYFLLRLLSSLCRNAVTVMLWTLMGAGLVETIYGFGQLYGWFASGHSLYRLTGSFFNPGPYSGFLVMVLPVVLFYCLSVYPGRQKSVGEWRYKLESGFVWGILLLILSILPAGMSRSSWLAAVAGCGVVTAFYYRIRKQLKELGRKLGKKAWWVAGIGVVCLLLLFSGLYLMKKDSADGRRLMWKIAGRAIAENPWGGCGLGYFGGAFGKAQAAYFATEEATEQEEWVAGSPEYGFNEYLQLGVELGIVGSILFLLAVGLAVRQLLYSSRPEKGAVLGGLTAFSVFACFSYPLSVIPLVIVFVLFMALAGTLDDRKLPAEERKRTVGAWFVMGASLLMAGITWRLTEHKEEWKQAYIRWGEEQRYFSMDIFEETVDHYRDLYPFLKDQPKFLFEYGQCLSKTGQYEEGIRILTEGTRLSADPMFYNIMGKDAEALKNFGQAEACFKQASYMVPHRLYPLYLLAKMYFESGQPEKGRDMARQVIQKAPKVMSDAVKEMKAELEERLKP